MTDRNKNVAMLVVVLVAVIVLATWIAGCSLFSLKPQLLSPPGAPSPSPGAGGALGEDNIMVQIVGSVGTVISLILYRTLWYKKRSK